MIPTRDSEIAPRDVADAHVWGLSHKVEEVGGGANKDARGSSCC